MVAGGREHIVSQIEQGDPVLLKPEPTNRYDPHAVAVYTAPRRTLLHPDELVSSVTSPPGRIHADDLVLVLDRQAGYIPKELAGRLDLPADGVVGWISTVRYKPPEDRIRHDGRSVTAGGHTPAGFDVTAWLEFADQDPEGGGWGA
jgi:hypothetical protein